MEQPHGKVEVKCELCCDSENKAEAFCQQCAMFICKNCVIQHKRLKPFLMHEVSSSEHLKQGGKPVVPVESTAKVCPNHEEPFTVNQDHNFKFCKTTAATARELLLEKLQPLKIQRESLAEALVTIQTTKQEVVRQQDSVANSIQEAFKELHNNLERREQELLKEAAEIGQQKIQNLSAQEESLSIASAELLSVVDYTEQCVRHCTDNEVMSMHTEIRRQIEQKIEEHSKSEMSLEPVEKADIGVEVRCAEALQQLCQTQANIIQLEDPIKCAVAVTDSFSHNPKTTDSQVKTEEESLSDLSKCSISMENDITLDVETTLECQASVGQSSNYPEKCSVTMVDDVSLDMKMSSDSQTDAGRSLDLSMCSVTKENEVSHGLKSSLDSQEEARQSLDTANCPIAKVDSVSQDTAISIDSQAGAGQLSDTAKCPVTMVNGVNHSVEVSSEAKADSNPSLDSGKCSVAMEIGSSHFVNEACTAVLTVKLSNNEISTRHHDVFFLLKCLYTGNETKYIAHAPTGPGQYSVQYTPTVRGRHELTVSVDGQQVAGSPFPVFVSIHPTQLGKPVDLHSDLANPRGIAVNSKGEVLVCDSGKVVTIDKYGGFEVRMHQNKVKSLWGIAVDDQHMYCVNGNSNKILRSDHSGGNILVREAEHLTKGLRGIAVAGDELMVCGKGNYRAIMVYDKQLKYVRRIESHVIGEIWALSADSHGNLFCADYSRDLIHVFTFDGAFQFSFGLHGEEHKLYLPCGICVSGHYVYVCNLGYFNVSIFTTKGEYVTSVGEHGSSGDFMWPHSVCVDKDGFVYVTDFDLVTTKFF